MEQIIRPLSDATRNEVLLRLRRIEGQVRGVQRMVEDGRDCRELVHQIAAMKAALSSVTAVVLECYAQNCLGDEEQPRDKTVAELIDMMLKASK